jgi:hypothetical protein
MAAITLVARGSALPRDLPLSRRYLEIAAPGLELLAVDLSTRITLTEDRERRVYRWFVGLNMDDPIWDVSLFTKNRQRLLDGDVAEAFFDAVLAQARSRQLLSNEHFTVDGTLIQAWAGLKSFQRKDVPPAPPDDPSNPTVNFHGERRSNATHASTTDPDARLFRKGAAQEARLYFQGHVLMDHRHGLAVGGRVTSAGASAERNAAVVLAAGRLAGRARR